MQPLSNKIESAHSEHESLSSSHDIPLHAERKEIRTAVLLPGQWEDVICCNLSTISLTNLDPLDPYETLSYVWEGEPGFAEIFLNGQRREITKNLFLALRRLRKRHEERTLWIDSLCIAQSNNVEKSHQVGLMREIYKRCARVCIWIGDYANGPECPPDTRTIEDTAKLLSIGNDEFAGDKFLDRGFAVFNIIQEMAEGKHFRDLSWVTEEDSVDFGFYILDAFVEFIHKPWWDRIWVVQEAILPPDAIVLYGSMQMSWKMFHKSADCMGIHFMHCCQDLLNLNGAPIQDLLYRFRTRKASQDCDMVYGLYGLANDMHMEPNYSLTKSEVYSQIVLHSIQRENNLSILEGQRKLQNGVPNWIYDWSTPEIPSQWYAQHEQLDTNQWYKASLTPCRHNITHEGDMLFLNGILVDKVLLVSAYSGDEYESMQGWVRFFKDCWRLIHDWHEKSSGISKPYSPKGGWQEAFWRTIIADRYYEMPDGEVNGTWRRANIKDVRKFEEMESKFTECDLMEEAGSTELGEINKYFDQIFVALSGRKLFMTEKGHMGFGNPQVGDQIWVLFGGRVPFVLRPNQDGSTFSMIGDCYLHEFMDGEAMVDAETKTRRVVLT